MPSPPLQVDRKEFTDVVQALYAVATTKPPPKPKVISSDKKTCCKKNLDPDGSKGIHKEWRFGKCRDCGMGEGKYNTAFQEWKEKQRGY